MKFGYGFLMLLSLAIFLGAGAVRAEGMAGRRFDPPRSECYLSIAGKRASMKGDFNGESAYVAPGKVIPVPKLSDGTGFGAAIGGRYRLGITGRHALGFEIFFAQSKHRAKWLDADGKATLVDWGFAGTWHLFADRRIQPFVKLSYGLPYIDYSPNGLPGVGKNTFNGTSFSYGGGVSYFLSERISLDFGVQSASVKFDSIGSTENKINLQPGLKSKSLALEGRVSFRFAMPS